MGNADSKPYLNFIHYSNFLLWDVKQYANSGLEYRFPSVAIGSVTSKADIDWVAIEDNKDYPILGVRAQGKGVYINRIASGKELTMRKYQKSKAYHLFYCKVRTVKGQWGVVYPEFEESYGSSNMQYLKIDLDQIAPEYLELLLKLKNITDVWDTNASGADGRHFRQEVLLNLKIPLPTLQTQKKLANKYNQNICLAEMQAQEAIQLERNIEDYLFDSLGLEKQEEQMDKVGLQFVSFKDFRRWGVEFMLNDDSPLSLLKSNKYNCKKLSDVCFINPQTDINNISEISFVPMKYVSDNYGEIIAKEKIATHDVKGYTKFQENDLIWARITPCMQNGKSAVATGLLNSVACGSTEYHVIRKRNDDINIYFIHSILRLKVVLNSAMRHFTGSAGQQRVPKEFLEELNIPLPSLKVQKEIADTIKKMQSKIKVLHEQAAENRRVAIEEFEEEIFQ